METNDLLKAFENVIGSDSDDSKTYSHNFYTGEIIKEISVNNAILKIKSIEFCVDLNEVSTNITVSGIHNDLTVGLCDCSANNVRMKLFLYEIHKNFDLHQTELRFKYPSFGKLIEIK